MKFPHVTQGFCEMAMFQSRFMCYADMTMTYQLFRQEDFDNTPRKHR